MNAKKFTATTSWAKSMSNLSKETRLEVYDALFNYIETGTVLKLSAAASAAFAFIKTDIDLEIDKTIAICEKRKENVLKRWHRDEDEIPTTKK